MERSLKRSLSLSYALVALICIFLTSILANVFLEKQFQNYVIKNQAAKNSNIVTLIKQAYDTHNKWDMGIVENIGIDAMQNGLIISVKDISGKTVWDARMHNNGFCQSMLAHISQNMMSRYPNLKGGYKEDKYPLIENSIKVGTLIIGYYGPYYYSDNDIMFLNTLNTIFLIVGILSLILSVLLGILMAGNLSRPILRVINTARMISMGNFKDRSDVKSTIREINQLTTTINDLAETLENQEVLRKRLTADVAHELRTPITTLQSHMEAIIDGIWEPSIERLKSCHEEIMRIGRMIGDLEKIAKYESENLILNRMEFDLTELAVNINLNFQNEYKSKNIDINLKGDGCRICADRDKISQVIINLVSNALKYTQNGGRVEMQVVCDENNAEFIIRDNGIGISEEDLPLIFERFYRADKSRSRMTGGAGIGLAIVKAIIDAHGGRVSVESRLGEGTEFRVTIPKHNI